MSFYCSGVLEPLEQFWRMDIVIAWRLHGDYETIITIFKGLKVPWVILLFTEINKSSSLLRHFRQ